MKPKYCKNCGEKLSKGTSFCTNCGAKIGSSQNYVLKKGVITTKNIIFSVISATFFLAALGAFMESSIIAGICMALIGLLILPIKHWQNFLTNKLKLNWWIKLGASILLFVLFGLFMDTTEVPDVPKVDTNNQSQVEQIVEWDDTDESSSKTDIIPSSSSSSVLISSIEPSSSESSIENSSDSSSSNLKSESSTESVITETSKNSTFSIHFIDVGQADAALVECDGEYMLIDGGNVGDSNRIYTVLKTAGANHLKLVVGTHAHEDHIGGLSGAFNYATADITLCPVKNYDSKAFNNFKNYSEQKSSGIIIPSVGDKYSLGSALVTIVGVNGGSSVNDTSIILKIEYRDTSFLFTGDAEFDAENAAIYSTYDLSSTVLKVGHHGSDTSTGYVFLREIMPQYAVISVGKGNSYGHPHDTPLSRLNDAGVKVFRTDLQGDIYCISDGTTVTFSVDKNINADTFVSNEIYSSSGSSIVDSSSSSSIEDKEENENVYDYVLNKNSKKFHYDWCGSAKKMKDSNKKYVTGARDEVIAMGYDPCKNCNP